MSSRMTCTSLERLAPLPSVPPRPPARPPAPVPGPLPFRDERRAAARSSVVPRKLHIISTPAISVPFPSSSLAPSALPPPPRPVGYVRCQIGTTTIAMFYWRRRPLSGRGSRTANGIPAQRIRLPSMPHLIPASFNPLLAGRPSTRAQWETSDA